MKKIPQSTELNEATKDDAAATLSKVQKANHVWITEERSMKSRRQE